MSYDEFIKGKLVKYEASGFEVETGDLNQKLFDWQQDIVKWALAKGKCAIFADCGLGKTAMQLEWAHQVHKYTGKPVLIIAPLAVSKQTKREGVKFGIETNICLTGLDVVNGINITNYERLERFTDVSFAGVCLDESSILKSFTGKIKQQIISMFTDIQVSLHSHPKPE